MSTQISSCPTKEELIECVENKSQTDKITGVKEHIKQCPKCRVEFTTILKNKLNKQNENYGSGPLVASITSSVSEVVANPNIGKVNVSESMFSTNSGNNTKQAVVALKAAYPYLEPPTKRGSLGCLGRYELLSILGEGGMGIVFEADEKESGRKVALKVLKPELTDDVYRQRFEREGKIASSLYDANVCMVYDVGVHNNVSYMAMELLKGESLEDKLKRDGWLPVTVVFKIAKQIAMGLAVAHEQKLVHRDIKPANIWLDSSGPNTDFKIVKILDFGLAKSVEQESQLTAKGMIVGTPNYMAPEQICGMPLDERCDLFSLGCVIYRMFSGKIPFEKENTLAVLHAVVESEIPSLDDLNKKLPQKVLKIMTLLLEKEACNRPSSARKVISLIEVIENDLENVPGVKVLNSMLFKAPDIQIKAKSRVPVGAIIGSVVIILAILIGLYFLFDKISNKNDDDLSVEKSKSPPLKK